MSARTINANRKGEHAFAFLAGDRLAAAVVLRSAA
jgi:hypothetical protein